MSDKDKIVGIDFKRLEKKVSRGVVAMLETLLERAKKGEITEMVVISFSEEEGFQQNLAVNPDLYDTTFFGEILDCGYAYREHYQEWDFDYD